MLSRFCDPTPIDHFARICHVNKLCERLSCHWIIFHWRNDDAAIRTFDSNYLTVLE